MKTLSAVYCVHNEEDLIKGSIERVLPHVDEVVFINNGCTDKTLEQLPSNPKIKIYDYEYKEPVDMGAVRTFALSKVTSDWYLQVDADEYYPERSMINMKNKIQDTKALSFRVLYYNLAWIPGKVQDMFKHFPDRLYRTDVVDKYEGVLPNDMTHVKKEFYNHRPYLEYDNPNDKSFENPMQPIIDAPFYHLARTRGYNYEYNKWFKYNKNMHPETPDSQLAETTRINQWVSGMYAIRDHDVPLDIPTKTIPNPKVSVIIPNFQYAEYVGLAIQSVIDQYHPAYEIIVVDDGSLDNSRKIISHYPVKLIEQQNQGVAAARNTGIVNSTGDYFICLDADDELAPDYIEKTLKNIGDAQICYTDMMQFGTFNDPHHKYPDFDSNLLKQAQIIPSSCALIDRHCYDNVGGFDTNEHYEDYGWWLRLDQKGFKFNHIPEPLFKYRQHGHSRIDELDKNQEEGFKQLRERYGKI